MQYEFKDEKITSPIEAENDEVAVESARALALAADRKGLTMTTWNLWTLSKKTEDGLLKIHQEKTSVEPIPPACEKREEPPADRDGLMAVDGHLYEQAKFEMRPEGGLFQELRCVLCSVTRTLDTNGIDPDDGQAGLPATTYGQR